MRSSISPIMSLGYSGKDNSGDPVGFLSNSGSRRVETMIGITGATGHLGNVIARTLIAGGEPVRMLARSADRAEEVGLPQGSVIHGDLSERDSLRKCFEGCDTVIHAAAHISVGRDTKPLIRTNVDGTNSVIEACRFAGVGKLITIGSI